MSLAPLWESSADRETERGLHRVCDGGLFTHTGSGPLLWASSHMGFTHTRGPGESLERGGEDDEERAGAVSGCKRRGERRADSRRAETR